MTSIVAAIRRLPVLAPWAAVVAQLVGITRPDAILLDRSLGGLHTPPKGKPPAAGCVSFGFLA